MRKEKKKRSGKLVNDNLCWGGDHSQPKPTQLTRGGVSGVAVLVPRVFIVQPPWHLALLLVSVNHVYVIYNMVFRQGIERQISNTYQLPFSSVKLRNTNTFLSGKLVLLGYHRFWGWKNFFELFVSFAHHYLCPTVTWRTSPPFGE